MIVAMNRALARTLTATLAGTLFLTGCETIGPALGIKPDPAAQTAGAATSASAKPSTGAAQASQPMPPVLNAEQVALQEGIELYNRGSFNEAIKRLGAPEVSAGSRATQLQAHKYTAFSYCVTSRQILCRQAFEKAFKLDRSFNLAPGEHGHPLWGPAFARAKKSIR